MQLAEQLTALYERRKSATLADYRGIVLRDEPAADDAERLADILPAVGLSIGDVEADETALAAVTRGGKQRGADPVAEWRRRTSIADLMASHARLWTAAEVAAVRPKQGMPLHETRQVINSGPAWVESVEISHGLTPVLLQAGDEYRAVVESDYRQGFFGKPGATRLTLDRPLTTDPPYNSTITVYADPEGLLNEQPARPAKV